jgi:carbonic anhydrase/acetyltransferase-like protein (isoleucine patch superfamily)
MQTSQLYKYKDLYPHVGKKVFLAPGACLIGDVVIGDDSSVFYNCVLRADINSIRIGTRTNIQDNTVLHLADRFGVVIGNDVTIGHSAVIHACTIGDNTTIGMGAIIMDGAVIGANSIVGAGSLVPPGKVFPDGSLILGQPAQLKRNLTEDEIAANHKMALKYCLVKDELRMVHEQFE